MTRILYWNIQQFSSPNINVTQADEGERAKALTEGPEFEREMVTPIPLPVGVEAPGDIIGGGFQSWENYGRIRSTSDHLPLFVEV
jgi:hypothetical protein